LIIHDQPQRVGEWVRERIPHIDTWGEFQALGLEKDGRLVAGAVYNHYTGRNVIASFASDGSRQWANRRFLFAIFDYPFRKLGCHRITVEVATRNIPCIRFIQKLGFTYEGTCREAFPDDDSYLFGMLRKEWENYGQ
jgi:RimJ/RimL family protein N-acetyltransferase